jgi:putative flippase GtrA
MKTAIQFIKFGLVGGVNTLVSLIVYYVMICLSVNYMVSTITGYLASLGVGYILNRGWVFKAQDTKVANSALKYLIIYGASLIINMVCMYIWIDIVFLSRYIAPILTLCITIPFNYIFSKFWAFRRS